MQTHSQPFLLFALIAALFFHLSSGFHNLSGPVNHAKCRPKGLCSLVLQESTGASNLDSVSSADLYMCTFEWTSAYFHRNNNNKKKYFSYPLFWHLFYRFKKFDNKYLKKILIREHQPKSSIVSLYKKMEIKLAIEMAENAMKISESSTASLQWVWDSLSFAE